MKKKRPSTSPQETRNKDRANAGDVGATRPPPASADSLTEALEESRLEHEALLETKHDLEVSREEYAQLYDEAPIGYLSLSDSGWLKRINLTGAEILGCDREKARGRLLLAFIAKEDRRPFLNQLSQCRIGSRKQLNVEFRLLRKEKDRDVFVELSAGPLGRLESGERLFQCALIDVSARKQAEEGLRRAHDELEARVVARTRELRTKNRELAREINERKMVEQTLRESDERFRMLVEGTRDYAIFLLNPKGEVASWNSSAERLKGYPEGEILGRHFSVFYRPTDVRQKIPANALKTALAEGRTEDEGWRVRKDGTQFWSTSVTTALFDENGGLKGYSRVTRDTTEARKAQEIIRVSEKSLADFFDHSPVGLFWIDPKGLVTRVNRAGLQLLDCKLEVCLGHPIHTFHDDSSEAAAAVKRLSERKVLQNHRVRLRRGDKSVVQVLVDANGMWEKGRMVHSRWFVRDVTRQAELEHQILTAGEDVRRRIGQDLHDDLCQQLTGIEFFSQTLATLLKERSHDDSRRASEIAKLIRKAITHTRNLAHGLSPISLQARGLVDALEELSGHMRNMFQIDCRFRARNVSVTLDSTTNIHLYRIAQEAVTNAVKHGRAKRVDIGLSQTKTRLVLAIKDNGIGIRKKRPPGKGMGLHVMQYRAGVISGTLVVQRNPGRGTTVVCSIGRGRFNNAKASAK